MTQLSRERLEEIALNDFATHAESVEMARRLLAAEGQEPVAYWRKAFTVDGFCYADGINAKKYHDTHPLSQLTDGRYWTVTPLYAAPQPVAVQNPVCYLNKFSGVCVTLEQQPDAATDTAVYVPLYAVAQPVELPKSVNNSIIAEQLEHILSDMTVTEHQRAIITCAVDRLNKNAERLQQAPQPAPVAQPVQVPICPKCGDTGMADSGGVQPWGEEILVSCDCSLPDPELTQLVHDLDVDGNHRLANIIQSMIDAQKVAAQPVAVPDEIDALRKDAARYRFLRDKDAFGEENESGLVTWDELTELELNEFDAATDARMNHPNVSWIPPVEFVDGDSMAEIYAELYRLREEVKGPEGFATWKDAAIAERKARVELAKQAPRVGDIDYLGAMAAFHSDEWHKMGPITGYMQGWNACRAAVLNQTHVKQPSSGALQLPENVRDALTKALQAMEFMGDTLNNLDAVCAEDVEFVTPAFDAVREVLAAAPQEPAK